MAFHVEISRGFRRARVFNLDADEVRRTVIERWRAGDPVRLGDRDWKPGECALRVLEGPVLDARALAQGQGWQNAERTAADVARELLSEPVVPVVALHADGERAQRLAAAALERLGWRAVAWGEPAAVAVYVVAPEDDDERAVGALVERLQVLAGG